MCVIAKYCVVWIISAVSLYQQLQWIVCGCMMMTVAEFELCDYYPTLVGVRSIVINPSVHLSVCEHISGTAGPIFTKYFVWMPCGCGSVLFWWCFTTLCTSDFMNDVTFRCNGPYGDARKTETLAYLPLAALRYRGAVWCLWMSCFICSKLQLNIDMIVAMKCARKYWAFITSDCSRLMSISLFIHCTLTLVVMLNILYSTVFKQLVSLHVCSLLHCDN